jgi:RNA polymerase sigma factor (sigma-70 family)
LLQDRLEDLYLQAAECWPGVFVPFVRFRARVGSAESRYGTPKVFRDLYLAIAVEERNQLGWETFYNTYFVFIRNGMTKVLNNPETAEEATQEFCTQIPQRIRKYAGTGSLYGWLAVSAANFAQDFRRRQRATVSLDAQMSHDDSPSGPHAGILSDRGEGARRITEDLDAEECEKLFSLILPSALESLRPKWQTLLQYRFYHGLTSREIARSVLHTDERNVSKYLQKALKSLKKRILDLARRTARKGLDDLLHCVERIAQ